MHYPLVLDVETQFAFQEVKHDISKLKVSVVGTYDYATGKYRAYTETELPDLFSKIEHASEIIGFNIRKFDLPVLSPYYVGDFKQFSLVDLLEEAEKIIGRRVSLNDLARSTLGIRKSGDGLMALDYYRKGEMDKLKRYCLDDVKITKELYDYAKKYGRLFYLSPYGKREFNIHLQKESKKVQAVSLSLPF